MALLPTTRFMAAFKPLTQITPTTFRDGYTFLDLYENLRKFLEDVLTPELDAKLAFIYEQTQAEVDRLTDEMNASVGAWEGLFDAFMDNLTAELEALNDQAVANLIRNEISKTREALNDELYSRNIPLNHPERAYHKNIKHNLPMQHPDWVGSVNKWGREKVVAAACVDTVRRELFIMYAGLGSQVVTVWDWDTGEYKTVFQAGVTGNISEGMEIVWESGARYLYMLSAYKTISRYNITETPAKFAQVLAAQDYTFDTGRTYAKTRDGWIGTAILRRDLVPRFNNQFEKVGYTSLPVGYAGYTQPGDNPASPYMPKYQAFCELNGTLVMSHGGYFQGGTGVTPYTYQGISMFTGGGDIVGRYLVHPQRFIDTIFASGQLQFKPRVIENEAVFTVEGKIYTLHFTHSYSEYEQPISSVEGILILEEFSSEEKAIDFSSCAVTDVNTDYSKNLRGVRGNDGELVNQFNGQVISNIVELIDYMNWTGIQTQEWYTSVNPMLDHQGNPYPTGQVAKLSRGVNSNYILSFPSGVYPSIRYYNNGSLWESQVQTQESSGDLALEPTVGPYPNSPRWRRSGSWVKLEGGLRMGVTDADLPANTWHKVATLPAAQASSRLDYYTGSVVGSATHADIRVNGADIEISISAVTTGQVILTNVHFFSPMPT